MLLYFWLRSRTFYNSPLLRGLYISQETLAEVANYSLLVGIIGYPTGYLVYSMSDFWTDHHTNNYIYMQGLCYENYSSTAGHTNITKVSADFTILDTDLHNRDQTFLEKGHHLQKYELTPAVGVGPHHDTYPMVLSTSFIAFQLMLHFLITLVYMVPFVQMRKEGGCAFPELQLFVRKCLAITGALAFVNVWLVFNWLQILPNKIYLKNKMNEGRILYDFIFSP